MLAILKMRFGNGLVKAMNESKLTPLEGGLSQEPYRTADTGGGGGYDGRIDRLEKKIESFDEKLREVEKDLSTIKEKLNHMPTKYFMIVTMASGVSTLLLCIIGIAAIVVRFIG